MLILSTAEIFWIASVKMTLHEYPRFGARVLHNQEVVDYLMCRLASIYNGGEGQYLNNT